MKTSLEMDTSTNLINPKPVSRFEKVDAKVCFLTFVCFQSQLQVLLIKEEGDPITIGEADFDLSVYNQPN